jgi:predicted peptidase
MRKKYRCFVMAPAVSRSAVWSLPKGFQKLRGAQRLPVVLEALDAVLQEHPVDPARVYVTGQSMGGFGTFGAIAVSPQTFAAAMPVCGGWDTADAEKMKSVPLWVFHGEADGTVPADRSRRMVEAIKQAGGSPEYTEYPGVGHNSWSKTYASPLTWEWLFDQRRAE